MDREGKPGGLWEWCKCSMSYAYTIQNCRTVHVKWVGFIVRKSYLNKVNFKKQETEYEQRRRETVFSLKCFFVLPLPLRLPRPSVYKLSQNITQNMMGKFAIKYINAFKNDVLIISCMLDALIITKDNLVKERPDCCSSFGGFGWSVEATCYKECSKSDLFHFDHMSLNWNLNALSKDPLSVALACYVQKAPSDSHIAPLRSRKQQHNSTCSIPALLSCTYNSSYQACSLFSVCYSSTDSHNLSVIYWKH